MKFDLPLHFTHQYVEFINSVQNDVYSVYFSLSTDLASDARVQFDSVPPENLIFVLQQLPSHIKKYVTFNGRYTPISYMDDHYLATTTEYLKTLYNEGGLTGILYVDFYYLSELAKKDSQFYAQIEAVPSINCFIDSFDKVNSHMMYLTDAGFKLPSKIIIDRSLNRRMEKLQEFSTLMRKHYPNVVLEILVNEGCLYNCPFKINHDIMISLANEHTRVGQQYIQLSSKDNSFNVKRLNEDYGCINYIETHPSRFFEMPFIRPEDLDNYTDYIDVVKISGKVKSDKFVFNAFNAYKHHQWDGNLIEILDAAGALDKVMYVFNDEIPETFHTMLTTCDKNCLKCRYCEHVAEKTVQRISKQRL